MARWALLAAFVLLSGCASPGGPEDAPDQAEPQDPVPPAPAPSPLAPREDESYVFYGHNRGVGLVMADGVCSQVGDSTTADRVALRDPASLGVILSWNLTVPTIVTLFVTTPDGDTYGVKAAPTSLERKVQHDVPDAQQGAWLFNVCTEGAAVVDYKIDVTVDYPGV